MSLTHSHTPFKFSFQSVTLPSPQLTAKMFPAKDHETRHTTSGNLPEGVGAALVPVGDVAAEAEGSSAVLTQGDVGVSLVQIRTVLSFIQSVSTRQSEDAFASVIIPVKRWQCNFWVAQCLVPTQHPEPNQCVLPIPLLLPTAGSLP